MGNALNSTINQNTVSVTSSGRSNQPGFHSIGFVTSRVSRNLITSALTSATGGYGGRGITIGTGTATSALTISNNVIYGVNGSNYSSFSNSSSMGIGIGMIGGSTTLTTTTGGIGLYFNSVSMSGSMGSGSTTATTAAMYVGSVQAPSTCATMCSPIRSWARTTQKNYAIYSAAANTAFTMMDYNVYFVSNTFNAASAIPGFIGSDRSNLNAIQAGFGQNGSSLVVDPQFNGTTNLQPQLGSPGTGKWHSLSGSVTPYNDYTGTTRIDPPSVGAYEAGFYGAGPVIGYTALSNIGSTANPYL